MTTSNQTLDTVFRRGSNVWINGAAVTAHSQTAYDPASGYTIVTTTAPDGSYSVTTNQFGRQVSVSQYDATGAQIGGTTYGYDAQGRQNTVTDARNGTTTSFFNNADQVVATLTPSPDGVQGGQLTTNILDSMGRVIKTILPDGTSVTNVYLSNGLLQETYGSRTYPVGYTYDYAGRMKTMTTWTNFAANAGVAVTTWNYDGYRGFLTNKAYADGKGPLYSYTAAGRLQTRTWARGITTTYGYDNAGGLAGVSYSDSTPGVGYTFDRLGRQLAVTNGATVCNWKYNDANELLSESYTGGPLDGMSVTNCYDSLLRRKNLSILNSPSSILAATSYGYDAASRLSTVGDGTNSASYSYLAISPLVVQITFKQNSETRMTTTKTYDYLNRLTGISSANSQLPSPISFAYSYNSANQRTQRTEADSSYWVYQYDSLGQVISGKKYWADGTPVAGQQFTYNFDDIGNRKTTASGGDASGGNLRNANYTNNILNQIIGRDVPGYVDVLGSANANATVTVNLQRAYRYGNYFQDELAVANTGAALWLSLTNLAVLNNGTNADIVATNTGNAFLPMTPETFGYDADGNMTNSGRWTITWDAENRATSFTSLSSAPSASKKQVNCAYDFQGRRIQKIVSTWNGSAYVAQSTNRFVYDGWNLVAEVKPDNSKIRTYMWGSDLSGSLQGAGGVGGLLEVSYYGTGGTTNCFPAFDGNGNVAALINAADGTVAANYEYAAFGEPIRITGVMAKNNPFRFSTKYADDESDLLYYGFRYYKPSTGTWPNRDPLQEKGGMNLYGFGNNDAVNQFDALGLEIKVSQNDDGSWDVEGDHGWSDSIKPGGGTRTSPTYTFETPRTVKSSILGYYGITANQSVSVKLLQIPQSQCTAYKSTPIIPSMPHVSVQWWPPPPTPTVTVGMTFGESGSDSVSVSYTDYLIFSEYTAAGSYQGKSRIWAKCACAEIETDASIKRDVFVNKGTVALYGVVAYAIAEAWGTEATLAALGKLVLATK